VAAEVVKLRLSTVMEIEAITGTKSLALKRLLRNAEERLEGVVELEVVGERGGRDAGLTGVLDACGEMIAYPANTAHHHPSTCGTPAEAKPFARRQPFPSL